MPPVYADMALRRLGYLAIWAVAIVFYLAYGQWLSWIVLIIVTALPWFSLLLSLPAIFRFRAATGGPATVDMGEPAELWLLGSCGLPMPLFRGRLRLTRLIGGQTWIYEESGDLQTNHCGGILVTPEAVKVTDYRGRFSFRVRCRVRKLVRIRPRPAPMDLKKDPALAIPRSWRPKSGGGFAENHELRLYRPGDSLNQLHWKLSAKTGTLVIREPMEPGQGVILLTMNLRGSLEDLDRKFGHLLWLGRLLLDREIPFSLRCLTGDGVRSFEVSVPDHLTQAIDDLLCCPEAPEGDIRQHDTGAVWHCHIGGSADEA